MKTIIITGAAHGVGRAIAKTLKNERLILIDQDEETLARIANELEADHFCCDLSSDQEISKLMKSIQAKYDVIDVLINNAGLWIAGELSMLDEEPFSYLNDLEYMRKVIDTNLYGSIAMTRSTVPMMIKQEYGQIININSQSGVKTEEAYPIYNASKTGGTAFRKAIQTDLAKHNIRITDVCPGLIDTDFYKHANSELPREVRNLGLSAQEVADVVKYVYDQPTHITIPLVEIMTTRTV